MTRAKAPGTCGLIAVLLLCLLGGLGVLAAPKAWADASAGVRTGAAEDVSGLRIGLEGAAFKDFLLFMGQFSGKNPVFREDQLPNATVTLVSRQGVSAVELAEMQSLVLAVAGLSAIPRGEVVYLLPDSRRPVQPAGPTQILAQRLAQGLATGQVVKVLERLRSDTGEVAAAGPGRWVVIRDQAERVARARAVLTALEAAPAGAELDLEPLGRAEAALAARKLDMHFRGLPGPAPVVLALEWSNSVLLAGSGAQLGQAQRLLSQLDSGGREVPALRAFRLRYARAAKVAAALRGLAESDKRLSGLRVRVDAEAGAVVVLAEPELMARVERLVEDMDQPRPRVLVEALVLELPAQASGQGEILAALPGPVGGASVLSNPPLGSPAGASGFAQAAVGVDVSLRGQAPSAPGGAAGVGNLTAQSGLDALVAQLAADPGVRVLARPRAAVPDGGDMSLSITRPGPAGAGAAQETVRQRLVFTPLQDPENGQLSVRVRLEDSEGAARLQIAEALLPEGSLLLLVARGQSARDAVSGLAQGSTQGSTQDSGKDGAKTGEGWTLFSHRQEDQAGFRRLCIVLAARVVRGGESAAGASRGLGEKKP
ncbi:MAG: hypothetical protein KKF77_12445 [Proteobacteria bacterium]|nr:hypothetical protein [Pseudomonadota bacterium]